MNMNDIEKARKIRGLREMIKQYSECIMTLRCHGNFRAMFDEAVMYDPLLTAPLPEEKEFIRNGFIKTIERETSELDESNKKLIEYMEETISLIEKEIADI